MRRLIRLIPLTLLALFIGCTLPVPPPQPPGPNPTPPPVVDPVPDSTPRWDLEVTVLSGGQPIVGAETFVLDGPAAGLTRRTDANGLARYVGLEQAGFTVCGRAEGFIERCVGVTLTRDHVGAFGVGIVLEREPINRPEVRWPAVCASYYTSLTDPGLDPAVFADWLQSVGVTCTRAWLLDAWALGERGPDGRFLPGQYDGRIPVLKLADGRFNLDVWDEAYFSHLRVYVDEMNRRGIWPHLTLLELYTWSDRKAGLPFVPDVEKNLFRFNVNGVRWGGPDDPTFFSLPDRWLTRFICKVVTTLDGTSYAFEAGNEMPEKAMNERIGQTARSCGFTGSLTINRQDDTPGQPFNSLASGVFDRVALHGKLDLGYLDEEFPEEASAGRPTTFRAAWPLYTASTIILSSDGGGGNPVHLATLKDVACDALQRGASYEHQLSLKRRRFGILAGADPTDRRLDMGDLSIDAEFLKSLGGCRDR